LNSRCKDSKFSANTQIFCHILSLDHKEQKLSGKRPVSRHIEADSFGRGMTVAGNFKEIRVFFCFFALFFVTSQR
jgi:hypothetical protein